MMRAMADSDAEPTPTDHLVELQRLDTEIDQLTHRKANLPEEAARAEAESAVVVWQQQHDALTARIDELGRTIVDAESKSADLGADKERLEAQMKTVIAPREAEALMHEIATIDGQRDEIETAELEALEAQADAEQQLEQHQAGEESVRAALTAAEAVAAEAFGQIDEQVGELLTARDGERELVPAALLGRYDRLREHHLVAVSNLAGKQCTGCHLDLSAAEIDDAKDEAAASGGVADCPQCGRMLVV